MKIITYKDEYKSYVINLILYIQNYESKINLSLAEQPDLNDIEKFYRKGGGEFWIAVENNRVIGTIGIMNKGNGFGIMKKFFVKADFRSQGIGLKLYNCLFRYAKKHKINRIILDTPSVAVTSHKFYERAGFRKITKADLPIEYNYPDRNSILYYIDIGAIGLTDKVTKKMIDFYKGNKSDIRHFLKVYAYAQTIGKLEHLDEHTQNILELSAIVHDIACPLCRQKYGNTNGKHQEAESEALLIPFFEEFNLSDDDLKRIIYIVSHHHTYTDVDGLDYQILLEADFLVNADESNYSMDVIQNFLHNVYKTESGISILKSIYLNIDK